MLGVIIHQLRTPEDYSGDHVLLYRHTRGFRCRRTLSPKLYLDIAERAESSSQGIFELYLAPHLLHSEVFTTGR